MGQNTKLRIRYFKKVLKRGDMTIYAETLQAREDIGFAPYGLDEPYRVFISEDPIGFEGGDVNLMAYVGNNPMLLIDPLGLAQWLRGKDDPPVMGSESARKGLRPGDSGMVFFERNVPNLYETSIQHDAMLDNMGIKDAYKDLPTAAVTILTMPIAFKNALDTNIYETIIHPIDMMKPVYNKIMTMCK
ncbi:MAG: hypothetical protein HZA10_08005 [Nitrospirae bacterium]|nr:hypothetical protein [Nitrospirota bacterium]